MTLSLHRSVRAVLSILLLGGVLFQALPQAATYTLAPLAYQTVLDTSGNPVSGAKICTYLAGTTTQTATYSDTAGTQNANPIRADSSGRFVAYLIPGASYKFVFQDATGTVGTCDGVTIRTQDNISAVPSTSSTLDVIGTAGEALTAGQVAYLSDGSGSKNAGQWYKADSTNTYSSSAAVSVGMVPTSIASGASGTIRQAGSISGLTSLTIGSTYYASSTPGALSTTQPANGRSIGIADTTSSLVLAINNDYSIPTVTTLTQTGTTALLAVPASRGAIVVVYLNNSSLLTIQGIAAAPVGQRLILISNAAGQVDLVPQSGSAAAVNRLINQATVGNTSLAPGVGTAEYIYDGTLKWRLVNHKQGAPLTAAYVAGNFTATAGTWTVDVGDLTQYTYYLEGKILTINVTITTASISNAGAVALAVIPGGYQASASNNYPGVVRANDNATLSIGMASTQTTTILAIRTAVTGAGWQIQANLMGAEYCFSFPVL